MHEKNAPISDWSELIEKARHGDNDALGQILNRTQKYLYVIVDAELSIKLRCKASTSDVVQQSMLETCQSINGFDGRSEKELMLWVKRIALNNIIDSVRRYETASSRSVHCEFSLEELPTVASRQRGLTNEDLDDKREQDRLLMRELDKLPIRQRKVIEARHRFGKAYSQISSEMNISEAAVRQLWSRGLKSLREGLLARDGLND